MTKRLIISGAMRSGTTMIAADVSTEILGVTPRAECVVLADILKLVNRWRMHGDEKWVHDWLWNSAPKKEGGLSDELLSMGVHSLMPNSDTVKWWVAKHPELILFPLEVEQLLL
jgi:hypothetical protein